MGVSQPVAASAAIAFHPLTTTLAYAAGSAVVLRDIVSDNSVRVFSKAATDQCTPAIRCLTFCPNARWLAAGEDGRNAEVLLYDLHKGAPTHPALTLRRHKYSVTSVCFSHDGVFAVATRVVDRAPPTQAHGWSRAATHTKALSCSGMSPLATSSHVKPALLSSTAPCLQHLLPFAQPAVGSARSGPSVGGRLRRPCACFKSRW